MNSWSLTGNLGQDAETRYTTGGDAVVSFSVAVTSGYGDKQATTWVRCQMWGKRGEAVSQYLTTGQQVGIVGELTAREWEDKNGQKRTSIDVRVNDLTLLGKREDTGQQQRQPAMGDQYRRAKDTPERRPAADPIHDMDSEIPF